LFGVRFLRVLSFTVWKRNSSFSPSFFRKKLFSISHQSSFSSPSTKMDEIHTCSVVLSPETVGTSSKFNEKYSERAAYISVKNPVAASNYFHLLPLPTIPHLVLTEEDIPSSMRIIVVGDVHGCFEELKEVLKKCNHNSSEDKVVLVGDLVNKGPCSAEVVQYARKEGFYCIRGNHDHDALVYALGIHPCSSEASLPEKYHYIRQLTEEDIEWFKNLPYTITIPYRGIGFVHAGLIPKIPLEKQQYNDMILMRNLYVPPPSASPSSSSETAETDTSSSSSSSSVSSEPKMDGIAYECKKEQIGQEQQIQLSHAIVEENIKRPPSWSSSSSSSTPRISSTSILLSGTSRIDIGEPWIEKYTGNPIDHIFFGHDARRGLQQGNHATGLDTGCAYGRYLTAIILPERHIVQVQAHEVYVDVTAEK
jgi:diadenosine tetraphosphatase ApaH/serine/threonine PP2A family protein phosphatase